MIEILCLLVGFMFLVAGSYIFIYASSDIAKKFRMSLQMIQLIIVSFSTSLPELLVSIRAGMLGLDNMVIYNVIGSNIINILLVLAISCIIKNLKITSNTIKKELPLTLLVTILFILVGLDDLFIKNSNNIITASDGLILILFFLIYLYYMKTAIKESRDIKIINKPKNSTIANIFLIIIGLSMIIMGSTFTVDVASKMINSGISERLLSLLIIALATSIPELITCIMAIKNKQDDLIIGNILGSNIFSICICISIPAIIVGNLNINALSVVDIINFVIANLLLLIFAPLQDKMGKKEGLILLSIFVIYYTYIILEGVLL